MIQLKPFFLVVVLAISFSAPVRASGPVSSSSGSMLIATTGYVCGLLTWAGGVGAGMTSDALSFQCLDENARAFWTGYVSGVAPPPILVAAYCWSRHARQRRVCE